MQHFTLLTILLILLAGGDYTAIAQEQILDTSSDAEEKVKTIIFSPDRKASSLYEKIKILKTLDRNVVIKVVNEKIQDSSKMPRAELYEILHHIRAVETASGRAILISGLKENDWYAQLWCARSLSMPPKEYRAQTTTALISAYEQLQVSDASQMCTVQSSIIDAIVQIGMPEAKSFVPRIEEHIDRCSGDRAHVYKGSCALLRLDGVERWMSQYNKLEHAGKAEALAALCYFAELTSSTLATDEIGREKVRTLVVSEFENENDQIRRNALMALPYIFGPYPDVYATTSNQLAINQRIIKALRDREPKEVNPELKKSISQTLSVLFDERGRMKTKKERRQARK